jgi:oxygen-dependent protoporphyrinogen oxidase
MREVVIAGAGISGLALGWQLHQRGVCVRILESEARVGGKIQTFRDREYRCESGPASYADREPALRQLVHEFDLERGALDASPSGGARCVVVGRRLEVVPRSVREILASRLLPRRGKLRVLADLVLPRGPAGRGEEESVAAFARRRLGALAAERLFYPLVSGLYAGDPEQTSVRSAFPSLASLERDHRSLLLGMARAARSGGLSGGRIATFAEGMEQLPRALAGRLGAAISLGAPVRRLERAGSRFRVHVEERGAASEIGVDAVVLASPAHEAAKVLAALDGSAAEVLAGIPYVPVALVYAGISSSALERPLDAYGFLVPKSEPSEVLGGVFTSSVFPTHAPKGETLVSFRLGGARQPEVATRADDALAAVAGVELRDLLGARGGPSFLKVIRHAHALPQYTLGHNDRLAALDAAERRLPGLFFAGNAYRGLGIPDCVRNAGPLADRIVAFLGA